MALAASVLWLTTSAWALAMAPGSAQPQAPTARQLLQRAVHLEEAVGDPEAAIAAYEGAIAAEDADAPLAAVAEFRLGVLLTRLGRTDEARAHHQHVLARYGEDARLEEVVRRARAALGTDVPASDRHALVARRLWAGSDAYAYGALSPDGSFLAFVDWVDGNGNLAIHDLDRGGRKLLTSLAPGDGQTYACSTVVAPDGKQVAYTWHTPDGGHAIHLINRDGSHDRILLDAGKRPRHIELEDWSKDGTELLAIVYAQEGNRVALISTLHPSLRTVREIGSEIPETASLSPDGHWIAYHRLSEGSTNHDIVVTSSDGTRTEIVVSHPANDLLPVWAPDGRHLLFVSDRSGTLGAWLVQVDDGHRRGEAWLVKPDFGRSIPMGFTDRGALVYALQASISDIYTARLDLQAGKLGDRVASSGRFVGVNRSPVWSADGGKLAYLSERGPLPAGLGPASLVVRDLPTGQERVLTPGLRQMRLPRWHPDGSSVLVVGAYEGSPAALYAVDAESGHALPLLTWRHPDCDCMNAYAISPDSERLVYLRPSGRESRGDLVLHELSNGSEVVLVEDLAASDLQDLEFAPDSHTVAAVLRLAGQDPWSLALLRRLRARTLATVNGALGAPRIVGWFPATGAGADLVYVRTEQSGRSLRRLATALTGDGDTAEQVLVADLARDLRDLRLHPDGHTLAYASGSYRAEIWMLENALLAAQQR